MFELSWHFRLPSPPLPPRGRIRAVTFVSDVTVDGDHKRACHGGHVVPAGAFVLSFLTAFFETEAPAGPRRSAQKRAPRDGPG